MCNVQLGGSSVTEISGDTVCITSRCRSSVGARASCPLIALAARRGCMTDTVQSRVFTLTGSQRTNSIFVADLFCHRHHHGQIR